MKTKLRRVAILALVLVLFTSNTIGALASTTDTAPKVTVSSYTGLYTALDKAKAGEVIGVKGTIVIPSPATYDYTGVTLRRMEAGAKIIFNDEYGYGGTTEVIGILFDGNARGVGGTEPFVEVAGDVTFNMCEFDDCYYGGGTGADVATGAKGGAVYVSSGSVTFSSCTFDSNCADYGGAIFNNGTVTINNSVLEGNWAEETGGAIYNTGTLTIKNTEVTGNTARIGGGLYNNGSTELYNTLVWNNTASIHGSDLANEGSLSDYTTEAEYNAQLSYYNLYYEGWADELDTSVGGTGEYKKLLTTDTDPTATPEEPTDPTDPTEPTDPEGGDDTGGDTEDTTTPEGGDTSTDTPPDEGGDNGSGEDPVDPEDPSDTEQGDNIDNSVTDNSVTDNSDHSSTDNSTTDNSQSSTDNSVTDNSTTDNSTVDNSTVDNSSTDNSTHTEDNSGSGNTTDNSTHSSTTDNSQHSSTVDNSSVVSNTDNSSSRSESSNTENSNNTTTYNYYQTEQDKGSTGAPQSISQPITINVTVPQAKEPETGTQEPTEASQSIAQNIHIEAEGVNVKYEYTADGVSISISPYIAPESPTEADIIPTAYSPVETPQEPTESPINWVDYVSMILLAILVLSELRDRWMRLKTKAE